MRVSRVLAMSWRSVWSHKGRSFLMMIGLVVGIATLSVILALGKGTKGEIERRVRVFGTDVVMVAAGGGKMFGPPDERVTSLTLEDARAIEEEIEGISVLAPTVVKLAQAISCRGYNTSAAIFGVTPEWEWAWDWHAWRGGFITEEDLDSHSRVCLLGQSVMRDLSLAPGSIGEVVRINQVDFEVKGILEKRGTAPHGADMDNRVIVPLTTAMRRLFNIDYLGQIRIRFQDPKAIERAVPRIQALLRERHGLGPGIPDDFRILTPTGAAQMARGVSGTITLLLSLISAISLVVSAMVVANVMLISVTERISEIGVRRALGARKGDIAWQFLLETLAITVAGGILGFVLGGVVALGISWFRNLPCIVSWEPAALSLAISVAIGVLSGLQPARKAAQLDPVEALRR
jgi:putative ABC transport system permease protein